tara:strand:+ start:407 stop:544 length:138 start_codon:yes stop_codon:yes gene_type:complete
MAQQSKPGGGLGTAHPVPYSPEEKTETKEKKEVDYNSLEEALTSG